MSSLVSLQVRGVRSFGTDEDDAGYVQFASPITLILGQNGCGKTTLIESLKYASCGDVPDNTNRGSGFLHDPKLSKSMETLALVKLKYIDTKGDVFVVSRPMKVTQKIKNLEFKRLDPSIKLTKSNRESKSISGRCADIDHLVTQTMGVSKAILNNVIFCHQEDSNWPLDEGSKVKARFDEIFEAKKYNQCIEDLRKLRKDHHAKLKLAQGDLNHLKTFKEEASKKRSSLADLESRMASSLDRVKALRNKLEPITRRLNEISDKEEKISRLSKKYETDKARLTVTRESIIELRNKIPLEFDGSDDKLKEAVNNFHLELRKKEESEEVLIREGESIEKKLKINQNQISSDQIKLGQLSRDFDINKERVDKRNSAIVRLCQDLNAGEISMSQLSEGGFDELDRGFGLIDQHLVEKKDNLNQLQKELSNNVNKLQSKENSIRELKAKTENSIDNKKDNKIKVENECAKLKQDLDEIDRSADLLSKLQGKLNRVTKEINELNESNDIGNLEEEVEVLKAERDSLEESQLTIDKNVQSLQKISSLKSEISHNKLTKDAKDNEIHRLLRKHGDSLKELLGDVPQQGIKLQLQSVMNRHSEEVKSKQEEINNSEKEIAALEAGQKHLFEKLRNAKQKLASDECTIEQACGSKDYESYLNELTAKLQALQDDKGTWTASEYMYRRYVQKLESSDPCCPLCHRGFNTEDEVTNLISDLSLKVRELPSKLRQNKEKLDKLQGEVKYLLQLKPKYDSLSSLKNVDIPNLQMDLEKNEKKLSNANDCLTKLQDEIKIPQKMETLSKNMFSEIVLLEQHMGESKKLEREIIKLEARLPPGCEKMDLDEVVKEQKDVKQKLISIRESIERIQSKIMSITSKQAQLQEEKNSIQSQQIKISGNAHMRCQLSTKLEENETLLSVLQLEIDRDGDELTKLDCQLAELSRQIKLTNNNNEKAINKANQEIRTIEDKLNEIKKLNSQIDEYERTGGLDKVKSVETNLSLLQREGDSLIIQLEDNKKTIDNIKTQILSQKSRERELDDNVKLREKQLDEKKLVENLKSLELEMGCANYSSLTIEKNKLRQEEVNINKEKFVAEGRQRELENSIKSVNDELNTERYKLADKKYRDKLIEIKVEETIIEDLGKFYAATDWALNHFHTEKMKIINDTIRDLWRSIYRGNDIDYIEIDTENEAVASVDKKRVYNYRVVQCKNGVKLDMRGRCSAGQKVLACLIIRIALAETFSANCGVLALDEPTTNLDQDNITGLSNALVDIVQSRIGQKNFQLIIITHDQTFLEILRRIDKVPFYFNIVRNDQGKSRINKIVLE